MKKLQWTEPAINDLQQVYDYIAEDSVFYADKFVDELSARITMLETFPGMGRIVPETNSKNLRELLLYSYRVMYHVSDEFVYITQITHMAQDFMP